MNVERQTSEPSARNSRSNRCHLGRSPVRQGAILLWFMLPMAALLAYGFLSR